MSDQMLRRPAVEEMTGLSRSSIYSLMSSNDFPRQLKLSVRRVAWRRSDVEAWLASRETARATQEEAQAILA